MISRLKKSSFNICLSIIMIISVLTCGYQGAFAKEFVSDNDICMKEQADDDFDNLGEVTGYIVETSDEEFDIYEEDNLYGASELTEAEVFNIIYSYRIVYYEGMKWTNEDSYYPYYHYTDTGRKVRYTGYGCAAFVFMLSNAAFGSIPDREHYDWNNIRVGDILRINNDTHSVIVLAVSGDDITVAEGNYNSSIHWGRVLSRKKLASGQGTYIWSRWSEEDVPLRAMGIYCASTYPSIQAGLVTKKSSDSLDVEYRWMACNEDDPYSWFEISPWTLNNEWVNWTPSVSGNYILVCYARIYGSSSEYDVTSEIGINYHKYIKDICQMPYEGGGYLIGFESFDNPNQEYQYEMFVMDLSLLEAGSPTPWVHATGKIKLQAGATPQDGKTMWTIWQPQYGYYITLFRLYDKYGNILDEVPYGFVNAY